MLSRVSEDVLVDRVDLSDRPVGRMPKEEVFAERANFRVVHILLFDRKGQVLLQKIASTKKRHPGYWGSSAAGYVHSGESYEDAAKRVLQRELGVSAPLQFMGKTVMSDEGCRKFIGVFTTRYEGPVKPEIDSVDEVRYAPMTEIRPMKNNGHRFTPTFLYVWNYLADVNDRG